MSTIINNKEIRVFGIKRSGNHAIINWIFYQIPGQVVFANHCYLAGKEIRIYKGTGRIDCRGINYWDFKKKYFFFERNPFFNKEVVSCQGASQFCRRVRWRPVEESSKIGIYQRRKRSMNPENQKKLQEYARGIAEILYQEAAPEDLASLGDIEKTIRQQTLDYVTPQLGIFLSKKQREQKRDEKEF